MKRLFLLSAFGMGMVMVSLGGCVHRNVYVQSPPPAVTTEPPQVITEAPPTNPPTEPMVAAPGPGYVYQPGYWSWQGHWVWVRGAWVVPPQPRAAWVPGHWVHRSHGWVWVAGHWRQ